MNATTIAHLPEAAQKKLAHLERIETRAHALARGLADRYQELRDALSEAQRDLGMFDRLNHGDDTDPDRLPLVKRVAEAREELGKVAAEQQGTHPGFSTEDIRGWLRKQGSSAKFRVVDTRLRLSKRERAAEALEANRSSQMAVRERIAAATNSPRTRDELRQALRAQIASLAARGTPQVGDDGGINWPNVSIVATGAGTAVSATAPDALGLLVWAIGAEKIAARLEADLPADDPDAMTEADQRAAIAQGETELLRLEREGEALAELLEGDGVFVRRNQVPVPVLLGIEVQ